MKHALAVISALLVGLALGAWSVKSDLRSAKEELAELKRTMRTGATRQSSLKAVTSALHLPDAPKRSSQKEPSNSPTVTANTGTNEAVAAVTATNSASRRTAEEGLKEAADLWRTRSALARDSFLSNIEATPVQQQMFDQALTKMNEQLGERIRQWADYIKQQNSMTAETGVRMMNNLSEPVIAAYDELDRTLAPGWREKAGEKFQLFDFINPEVALPLTEVEGKINRGHF